MPKRFPTTSHARWTPRLIAGGVALLLAIAWWADPSRWPAFLLARWLGVMAAPGVAAYLVLERREHRALELALFALALSPLLAAVIGIAGLAGGVAAGTLARTLALASLAATALLALRARAPLRTPPRREWIALALLAAAVVLLTAFLPATREWWRVRSDAWFHAAVVAQIDHYGLPPTDPYFAGLPLQYMWFYHVLVLVLARGLDADPFSIMAMINAQAVAALTLAAYHLAGVFRARLVHRVTATAVLLFGFNAAFWVFLPVKLLKVVAGDVRGFDEIKRTYALTPFNYSQACGFMNIYFNQEFFLDKFMVATAFGLSLAFMTTAWYASTAWLRERRFSSLALAALALAGMLGFHSLVGFVMLVGIFGGAALLFLFRARVAGYSRRDTLWLLLASLAVFLAAAPYLYQVMHLKEREQVFPLSVSLAKTGGIFISCAFVLFLAWRGRAFLRASDAASRFFVFAALALTAFCLVITLPGPNTYDKLGYFVFIPLSVVAGFALADALIAPGRRAAAVAWTLAFLVPVNAIAFASCYLTPDEAVVAPDEARLAGWLREHTPRDALLLEDHDRVTFLVTVPRRYFWGSWPYAWQWGYPRAEMSRRLHARRALYSPKPIDATALEVLGGVEEELYAVVRPEHRAGGAMVTRRPDLFVVVHEDGQLALVRIDTAACRAAAGRQNDRVSTEELLRESGL